MRHQKLGSSERAILKVMSENQNELDKERLFRYVRLETDKKSASLSWTVKNMTKKGILFFDPYTGIYTVPDHWRDALLKERNIDAIPQQILNMEKRLKIFQLALENQVFDNEIEAYAAVGMLDIDLTGLRKIVTHIRNDNVKKDKDKKREQLNTSILINEFRELSKGNEK